MTAIELSTRHAEFCPLDTTLKVLDGKWKSIILCRLMAESLGYTQLLKSLKGCTRRMLSLQLNQLVADRIVEKTVNTQTVPIQTRYSLTPLGESLVPVILEMNTWGRQYIAALQD